MTKRGTVTMTARPRDKWFTPEAAALPVMDLIPPGTEVVEPCAGDGALVRHLPQLNWTVVADIDPDAPGMLARDALAWQPDRHVVTNPPYTPAIARELMSHWLQGDRGMTLLIPSDWLCNKWFGPYAQHVSRIRPVGRVSWIGNGKGGFENYAWVQFAKAPQGLLLSR